MKKYNYLAEEFLKLHTFKPVRAEFILVSGAKPNGKKHWNRIDKTHVGSVYQHFHLTGPCQHFNSNLVSNMDTVFSSLKCESEEKNSRTAGAL